MNIKAKQEARQEDFTIVYYPIDKPFSRQEERDIEKALKFKFGYSAVFFRPVYK